MSVNSGLRFLRPYLSTDLPVTKKSAYVRFFHSARSLASKPYPQDLIDRWAEHRKSDLGDLEGLMVGSTLTVEQIKGGNSTEQIKNAKGPGQFKPRPEVMQRIRELEDAEALVYPRIEKTNEVLAVAEYAELYKHLKPNERRIKDLVTLRGRVHNVRIAGKALMFMDIIQEGHNVQGVCNLETLGAFSGLRAAEFRQFYHLLRRGDIVSFAGHPYVTKSGQLSITAVELPTILSPSLASLPYSLEDAQTRIRYRHVDLLVNKRIADTLRVRSHLVQYIRNFLLADKFLEVQTPIVADNAGGAIARPFTTVATEFSDKQLTLRIAPEIWLKRMILGGMDRVFEIGPAFRNEGLDATHNPEFTTCEFYKSFASLEDLISMTEQMTSGMAEHVSSLRSSVFHTLPELDESLSKVPFNRLQFIPTIESHLGESLPDLTAQDAVEKLLELFKRHLIPFPASSTLPRLLDKLSAIYIEPRCKEPTFIMHHPACMAPLAKSFFDPATKQEVSARVELFIHRKEIANMYEEENSPFEQRRKFVEQLNHKDDENEAVIDESYLEALEWGLPPTGGWGCGIDRLCMLLSGSSRISDVLPFGSLKNVVNLGKEVPRAPSGKEKKVKLEISKTES